MRILLAMLLIILTGQTWGCASAEGYPSRSDHIDSELKALDPYYAPDVISKYNALTTEPERRASRDETVDARIRAIDLHFGIFEKAVSQESETLNVATDWAVLALSGAGATVPSATTKAILAATSGGIVGAKGSVDKNIFYQKTMPALLTAMQAQRKAALVIIREGLTRDTKSYPLTAALTDLEDYYNAGTIPGAILGITSSSGATAAVAAQSLQALRSGKFQKDEPGDRLQKFLFAADGSIITSNKAKLDAWLQGKGFDVTKISYTVLIRAADFASIRQQAVSDLGIDENGVTR